MGVINYKPDIEFTEEKIIDIMEKGYFSVNSVKYFMSNLYVFDGKWESDFLAMTRSGYLYEGEVKISRADFKKDFEKKRKHRVLSEARTEKAVDSEFKPHYFFYVVPEGLISEDEVPDYAGLVYITKKGKIEKIKNPPKLHSRIYTEEDLKLAPKFYYNMMSAKNHMRYDYKWKIENLTETLDRLKTVDGKKYRYDIATANEMVERLTEDKEKLNVRIEELRQDMSDLRYDLRIQKKMKETALKIIDEFKEKEKDS